MRRHIENWILKHLLNATVMTDIISNDPKTGVALIDGKPIEQNELTQLKVEIKALEGFRIWQIMYATTKHNAEERVFNKSITVDDIRFGKAMLYNLSLQQSIIEVLKNKLH